MPEVLAILKRKREMKKGDIVTYMRRSIGWALNRLAKEDYVANPRWGVCQITNKGSTSPLSPKEAMEIMQRCTEQERIARKGRLGHK